MTATSVDFEHRHAGHCESGVTAAMLSHYGLPISEAMVFGLSSAIVFVHFPFVRVSGVPLTSYRMPPGAIYRGLRRSIGLRMKGVRFRDGERANRALDERLAAGEIAGVQSSVYWLPYFPPDMRFHFNAHNLIVYGREGDDYVVSDPVFEAPQRCARSDLAVARFARGKFAPKGLMYYPAEMPTDIDYAQAARKAIRRSCRVMLNAPVPWVGVRGIRRLARQVRALQSQDPRYARLFVTTVIRMQEEIGTGGGGFRFMYAAFLQELAGRLGSELLASAEEAITEAGNSWRAFALDGARYSRSRDGVTLAALADRLDTCADNEQAAFKVLQGFR